MIEDLVQFYLKWDGWQCENIKNTGTYRPGIGWTVGRGTAGSADLSAVIRGRSYKIEVKWGKDKQSEAQRKYQENIERAGGVYWIIKDFDDFLDKYNTTHQPDKARNVQRERPA